MEQLLEWMEIIEDTRQHRKVWHNIKDILIIVLFATLANGIYFWENSFSRAQEWAESYCEREHKKHPDEEKKKPAVIGAVIALGHCLNLTDYGSANMLKIGYDILSYELMLQGKVTCAIMYCKPKLYERIF